MAWFACVAVWLCLLQGDADVAAAGAAPRITGRVDGAFALLELEAPAEQVFVLPEGTQQVGGDGTMARLGALDARPGLSLWRCSGIVRVHLDIPQLKALGLHPLGRSWLGLEEQVVAGGAVPGRFFVIAADDVRRVGRFVVLDEGAARIAAACASRLGVTESRVGDQPSTSGGREQRDTIIVSSQLDLLRLALGRIADHPLSNLVVCPSIPGGSSDPTPPLVEFLVERVRLRDRVQTVHSSDVLTLRVVEAVAEAVAVKGGSRSNLLADAALHLATYRARSTEVVARLREHPDDLSQAWMLTRVAGPAWHLHGGGNITWEALERSAHDLWTELQKTIRASADIDALQLAGNLGEPQASPELVLFGRMNGVIDDCGCKGEDSGGLARVAEAAVGDLQGDQIVSAGDVFASLSSGRSDPDTVSAVGELLRVLSERCRLYVHVGMADLATLARSPEADSLLEDVLEQGCITCNVHDLSRGRAIGRPRPVTLGGERCLMVGVTGVRHATIGRREVVLAGSRYSLEAPDLALARVLEDHASAGTHVDGIVLVGSGISVEDINRCRAVAGDRLRIVVTGSAGDPVWLDGRLQARPGACSIHGVPVIGHELSSKGVTCISRAQHGWQRERRMLQQVVESKRVVDIIRRQANVDVGTDLLAALSIDNLQAAPFVGSERCAACHLQAYQQWQETPHAIAYDILVESQRHHQDACVACHVTGFGVGGFAPVGASARATSTDYVGVGCEVCHGPGGRHVAAPAEHRMTQPTIATCAVCHTVDHSHFADATAKWYWSRVLHK